jgi:hypothetical protein
MDVSVTIFTTKITVLLEHGFLALTLVDNNLSALWIRIRFLNCICSSR